MQFQIKTNTGERLAAIEAGNIDDAANIYADAVAGEEARLEKVRVGCYRAGGGYEVFYVREA